MIKWIFAWALMVLGHGQYMEAPYAEWAHSHLVWINAHEQNQEKVLELVEEYKKRNIKVGAVNIDSGWSTKYNNFEWDYKKFPDPSYIIDTMHDQNIKVILWVTSVINNDTDLYKEGVDKGYFLNHGKTIKWWHGHGALLDYLNPQAVEWWHTLMDKVLDMGIDGWKCDGTDPLAITLRPWPYSPHAHRLVGIHEYGHHYYGDFYNYTNKKRPSSLIMSRPSDFYYYVKWDYSPKYVMFSGWVGDQDSSAEGFRSAMSGVLLSAWAGYLNFAFDIGGYRGQNITKAVFIRWMQTGALLPFMENGGNGRHQPWTFDNQTVDIYRKFVDLHYELKPTFLSAATRAYQHGKSVIQPLAAKRPAAFMNQLSNFGYLLCDDLLVFPIFAENGMVELVFPKHSKWIYYFDHEKVFDGGISTHLAFPLNEAPFFMRQNSVIGLQSEILVVMIEAGLHERTFIYGTFSENISVQRTEQQIRIKVERFWKEQTEQDYSVTRTITFIGVKEKQMKFSVEVPVDGEPFLVSDVIEMSQ